MVYDLWCGKDYFNNQLTLDYCTAIQRSDGLK